MIRVHQYIPAWGLEDLSPFCLKVNVYLRMNGLPYARVPQSPLTAPKGKLPYLEHQGRRIADSSLIVEFLKKEFGDRQDAWLNSEQRAIGAAFKSLLEEHTYFVILYQRWKQDAGWQVYQPILKSYAQAIKMPGFVIPLFLQYGRHLVKRQLHFQGTGRHSPAEVEAIGQGQLRAVADYLGQKPFFLGDQATSYDAVIYSFLAHILRVPFATEVKKFGLAQPNLDAYLTRMEEQFNLKADRPDDSPQR
jgi:glutathione S-transferase